MLARLDSLNNSNLTEAHNLYRKVGVVLILQVALSYFCLTRVSIQEFIKGCIVTIRKGGLFRFSNSSCGKLFSL